MLIGTRVNDSLGREEQAALKGPASRLLLDMRAGLDRCTPLILAVTAGQHEVRWWALISPIYSPLIDWRCGGSSRRPCCEAVMAMLASVLLQVQMARLLLEYGAKVNLHDEKRQTALHYAVLQRDEVRGRGSRIGVGVSQERDRGHHTIMQT